MRKALRDSVAKSGIIPHNELSGECKQLFDDALNVATQLSKKAAEPGNEKINPQIIAQYLGLRDLILYVSLVMIAEPDEETVSVLKELKQYYNQMKEPPVHAEAGPIEVLTGIMINLLHRPSSALRQAVMNAFKAFVHE